MTVFPAATVSVSDSVERLPEGVDGAKAPHFWQKNTPAYYPDWIPRIELPSERGKPVDYALINDERTLLYFVNQGALTFHTWFSRVDDLDTPDFALFDLDRSAASFAWTSVPVPSRTMIPQPTAS